MPRRRQRFSRLRAALKLAGGSGTAGSPLANFVEFEAGKRKIEIKQKVPADQRQRLGVALLPFNLTAPANAGGVNRYRATITRYSDNGRKGLGLGDNECGYSALADNNQITEIFYPAQLIIFIPTPNAAKVNVPNAGVTGRSYKKTPGKSITVPFGRATGAINSPEETRRADLANTARTGVGDSKASSVSYKPEFFGNALQEIPALIDGQAADAPT